MAIPFDLPSEILSSIFQYLDTKDILQSQLVCYYWSKPAKIVLYANVSMTYVSQLQSFIHTVTTSSYGTYTRQLYTLGMYEKDMSYTLETESILCKLAKATPALEKLKVSFVTDVFWIWLKKQVLEGQWQHLNTIPYPTTPSQFMEYSRVVWAMRNRLKNLKIFISSHCELDRTIYQGYEFWRKKLDGFACLEKLVIDNPAWRTLYDYDSLIDACPCLKEFQLSSTFPVAVIRSNRKMHLWTPNYSVNRLDLLISICSKNEILYIIQKFKGLKHLSVHHPLLYPITFEQAVRTDFGNQVADRFIMFIHSLESFQCNGVSPRYLS
ncbi:uncharacterized protein B0P05DRAFT_574349 [Gilbertella persicaria]|uniref:uncharacterized protein n=1 Tax=Gilbertella persicaria TaxID=101096 RepID=UPI00221E9163|nr:uncharacterized protein B0P05DRAFT_574349 [Gilbertella persicaria]KAI8063428.1 hypothetical protein B0P05DRAFT_574349 [Gilbertella persicaria]